MRRGGPLRLAALLALALAVPLWIAPHGAFSAANLDGRDVGAAVVSHASAYVRITPASCNVNVGGGSCAISLTNLGQKPVRYTATLATEQSNAVDTYSFPSTTPESQNPVTTNGEIGVGDAVSLTVVFHGCACPGSSRATTWHFDATRTGEVAARVTSYAFTATYGVS